jgi:trimeric autotransporter adhesin
MALTDLQMAAALCEQVYRRDNLDQQLDSTEASAGGFGTVLNIQNTQIAGFTLDNGFYYNNVSGFVAQIVQANGKIFVVFRGSDLSSGFGDALIPALFGDPLGGGQNSSTVDQQDWANNFVLGLGTVQRSQLDDAVALLQAVKAANPSGEIVVTGQSLGGGLAGLATAIENVRGTGPHVTGIGIAAAPFNQQLKLEAALLALESHGISLAEVRTWLPELGSIEADMLGSDLDFKTLIHANKDGLTLTELDAIVSARQQKLQNLNTEISSSFEVYRIKGEALDNVSDGGFALDGLMFPGGSTDYDVGAGSAGSKHGPALHNLVIRTADGSEKFQDLLTHDAALRVALLELGNPASPMGHDRADPSGPSKVLAAGPNPSAFYNTLWKSVDEPAGLYSYFYKVFNDLIGKGENFSNASVHKGTVALALSILRDAIQDTTDLLSFKTKLGINLGLNTGATVNFAGGNAIGTPFSDKVVLHIDAIVGDTNHPEYYAEVSGRPLGVNAIDVAIHSAFLNAISNNPGIDPILISQIVQGVLATSSSELLEGRIALRPADPWKVLVSGGGNTATTMNYDAMATGYVVDQMSSHAIFGAGQKDIIAGSNTGDYLLGGGDDDKLTGNGGYDILVGGAGYDVAQYRNASSDLAISLVDTTVIELNAGLFRVSNDGAISATTPSGSKDVLVGIEEIRLRDVSDVVQWAPDLLTKLSESLSLTPNPTGLNLTINGGSPDNGIVIDGLDFSMVLGTANGLGVILANSAGPDESAHLFASYDFDSNSGRDEYGLHFSNFENVIGTAYNDVLNLWRLNPGGVLTPAEKQQLAEVKLLPFWADSIQGMTNLANQRVVAAGVVPQNQIQVYVEGGDGKDLIIGSQTGVGSINGGKGNDALVAGGFSSTLYGDAGDDWLFGNGFESKLNGGSGKDTFDLANNATVMDASSEDYVSWYGLQLTGGVQQRWDESGWADYSPAGALVGNFGLASVVGGGFLTLAANLIDAAGMLWARYAINDSGDVAIQMCGGLLGQAYIKNYHFDPTAVSSGHVEIFRVKVTDHVSEQEIRAYIKKAVQQSSGGTPVGTDPLVIDLDRDGLELTRQEDGVYFDIDNDGFAEHTGWVGGDDGLLARDLNGNGKIDSQSELFGAATVSGFTALAALDSNGDGVINASDTGFGTLRVWRDLNGNGVTDAGELKTLAESGISSISLATSAPASTTILGNTIRAVATVNFTSGQTSTISDVVLENNQLDSVFLGNGTVSTAAGASLKLKGYGNTTNLDVAMTNDAGLLTLVNGFKGMSASSSWDTLKAAADDILFRWAGVSGVTPTAMTSAFDLQKLAFLEAFSGNQLTPRDAQGNPSLTGINELVAAWDDILDRMTIRLAAQGPLAAVFGNLALDVATDTFNAPASTTLADIYTRALQQLSTTPATALTQWTTNWGPMLDAFSDVLVRSNGIGVHTDYEVASLVRAMTLTPTALTLVQLVGGLHLDGVIIGTAGNDSLTDDSVRDTTTFVGDAGNDTMSGGYHQDVYVFGSNFGQDTIIETGGAGTSGDRIRFSTLNASDVHFARVGNDLVITVNNSTDTITIKDQYAMPTIIYLSAQAVLDNGIEDVQFADGTVMGWLEIGAAVGMGTAASETLTGTGRSDQLQGGLGNDVLLGGDSGDLYVYNVGDGNDTITDVMTFKLLSTPDMVALLGGFTPEDLRYERVADGNDLKITFANTSGSIVLTNQFFYDQYGYHSNYATNSRIEVIGLDGGLGLNWIEVQQNVIATYTTDANDITYGFGTGDSFGWSKGNDLLIGFDGGDTYNFGRGAGQDIIDDRSQFDIASITSQIGSDGDFSQPDAVTFDAGLTLANLTFTRVAGTDDLRISINGTTDTLTIKGQFSVYNIPSIFSFISLGQVWSNRVEEFKFADGSSLTWQQVLALTNQGTAGNDVLYGAFNSDTLEGKAGNDYLQGQEEADTYVFGRGDGQDIVEDNNPDPFSKGDDSIVFKSGIAVNDVIFSIAGTSGEDFLVKIDGSTDQILIKGQFDRLDGFVFGEINTNRIELFKWADGTTKTWDQVLQEVFAANKTPGADTILGTNYDDVLDGGAGNDILKGADGDDTYIFGRGYGQDTVLDVRVDRTLAINGDHILIKADTLSTDVDVSRGVGEAITLSIRGTSDSLTILQDYDYDLFANRANEVEWVEFANGTKWLSAELRARAMASQATAGNDTVRGFYSADIVTGGAGTDTLAGGDGSDTYRFNLGDGHDTITDIVTEIVLPREDVIELGAGLTTANIVLSRPTGTYDLVINFTGTTEQLTVKDQFLPGGYYNNYSYTAVETIKFANGAIWSDADIRQKLLVQAKTSGNDIITGFFADDTIDGGAGNDALRGLNGNDTYVFGIGSGQDIVEETSDVGSPQTDTVQFGAGVTQANVVFTKLTNDLKISISGTSDVLTIKDHFLSFLNESRVEIFKFADGTSLSYQDVNVLLSIPLGDGATLQGTAAADTITGTAANDVIAGRGGNDTINSAAGSDRFLYAAGDGSDTINETSGSTSETDVLELSAINPTDVKLTRSGSNLLIQVVATGHVITVTDQFLSTTSNYGVEQVKFADGTIWDRATLATEAIFRGTATAETLTGNALSTGYDTGAGNDTVNDLLGGNDRYYWGAGDGNDTVTDLGTATDINKLYLKNLYQDSVSLVRLGADLKITILATGELLTIAGQFSFGGSNAPTSGVESIIFADGQELARSDLLLIAPIAGTGGTDGDDGMYGLPGTAETLSGGSGNDTYLFTRGAGHDTISDNGYFLSSTADQLSFGAGISFGDLEFSRVGDDVIIKITGTADQVTLYHQMYPGFYGLPYRIESVAFANGQQITAAELDQIVINAQATPGNDTLVGFDGSQTFDGGLGNDLLRGLAGGDTYLFGRGSGLDTVDDSGDTGPIDSIVFAPGLSASDIQISHVGDDLVIKIIGTTDQLTVKDMYRYFYDYYQTIEQFKFYDGTIWTSDIVKVLLLEQAKTTGNDTIVGFSDSRDILDGGAGNDFLSGSAGGDTYVFGRGYGADVINDGVSSPELDTVVFKSDIRPGDLTLTRSGSDLIIAITGTPDQLTIFNQYQSETWTVEEFRFTDGTVWSNIDVQNLILASLSTNGNDTILGFATPDVLNGLAGNDSLTGGLGDDIYIWGRGYGSDTISDIYILYVDEVHIKAGVAPSDIVVSKSGNDLILTIAGTTDQLIIKDQLSANSTTGDTIEKFVFADGTVWTNVDAQNKLLVGTAGNDILVGFGGNDPLYGLAGNDSLDGGKGDDVLNGGSGADTLIGGEGVDTASYASSSVGVSVLLSTTDAQVSLGDAAGDTLSGIENLTGSAFADTLTGDTGANTLDGGTGADTLAGGLGDDIYIVDNVGDIASEGSGAGIDLVRSSIDWTLATNLENLTLTGATAFYGTGNTAANIITGNTNNNTLDGGAGADTLIGGLGDDTYIADSSDTLVENAGEGTDTVRSAGTFTLSTNIENLVLTGTSAVNGSGNVLDNILTGNTAANILTGGLGNDTYVVDNVGDTTVEVAGEGTDLVQSAIAWTLASNLENLTLTGSSAITGTGNTLDNVLTGNSGVNTLNGGSGNDTLDGAAGADILVGGLGDDIYVAESGDTLTENAGEGTDTVKIATNYTLLANFENLILTGTSAITGTGNALDNIITGNVGVNTLSGGSGNDTLDGAAGADILAGGLGDDTYIADSSDTLTENVSEGTDTVRSAGDFALAANIENLILTGTAAINGTGNSLANVIIGNTANNILDGGTGADSLSGGLGNDTYIVDTVLDVTIEAADEGTDFVQSAITWTLANNVENLTLTGGLAIDGTGNSAANVITGNAAANSLAGGFNDDSYVYARGGGNDTIVENYASGTDKLVFSNINQSAVTVLRNGNDATLLVAESSIGAGDGGSILLKTSLEITYQQGVEQVQFANGTLWTQADLRNILLTSTSANENFIGFNADDSYFYARGGGNDTITDNYAAGIDKLVFANINQSDVTLVRSGNDVSLMISESVLGAGDAGSVLLKNSLDDNVNTGVEQVQFANGTTWTQSQIRVMLLAQASSIGNDTITGFNTADVITGGKGNDLTAGANGNDNYIYSRGDGNDTITENYAGGIDTLVFSNINSSDVTLVRNGEDITLVIAETSFGAGDGGSVLLKTSVIDYYQQGVDQVQFANGTIWTQSDFRNMSLIGTSGNDILVGFSGNDTITGLGGNDSLDGGAGADTLIGGLGDDLYIADASDIFVENSGEGTDTVQIASTATLAANFENLTLTGTSAVDGTGNGLDNVLTGNTATNSLTGAAGNDVLDGGAGADTLVGGLGNDTYVIENAADVTTEAAGEGTDLVQSTVNWTLAANFENLTLTGAAAINGTGNTQANMITGNAAANILDGGAGADTLIGGLGDDIYIVDSVSDVTTEATGEGVDLVQSSVSWTLSANIENLTLTGASAIDATGNTVSNVITGNSNANILDGGTGADTLIGGLGNDTYIVDNIADITAEVAGEGTDLVQSSISWTLGSNLENLSLLGTAVISGTGNSVANVITGNTAANSLDGGLGADTLIGGLGDDIYVVDNVGDVTTENAGEGTDTVQSSTTWALATNLENLTLTGTSSINGTGNTVANIIIGNASANILDGGSGLDTLIGGLGDDTYIVDVAGDITTEAASEGTDTVQSSVTWTIGVNLENLTLTGSSIVNGTGNMAANVITGNTAANILDGGLGADTLIGGLGDDTYVVDNVGDVTTEAAGAGTDTVQSSMNWTLATNLENLTLVGAATTGTGNTVANVITGNSAANSLDGGLGADTLIGGLGDDTYIVDNTGDVTAENASEGTDTVQSSVTWTLATNLENLTLTGGTAAINGTGNTASNLITGNAGANSLDGGAGIDTLIGGLGDDTYIVDVAGDVTTEAAGEGTDTVQSAITWTLGNNLENLTLTGASVINGTGNTLANVITGNGVANILDGGIGADTLIGGLGDDTYTVDNAGDATTEAASAGTDTVQSSITWTLAANLENLLLTGAAVINGTGNAAANTITGNSAANILDGGAGTDNLIGGLGDDVYIVDVTTDVTTEAASAGIDLVQSLVTWTLGVNIENLTLTGSAVINGTGNTLDNILTGNSAANILTGGTGNDTYFVGAGDTTTELAGEGTDLVQSAITWTLANNLENLTLTGGAIINGTGNTANNIITGNGAANILDGLTGADTLIGGLGDDTYVVENTLDVTTELAGEGTDTVQSIISWALATNVENLTLTGTSIINGTGNAVANVITGNGVANILDGGLGADTLIGGLGDDTYVVDNVGDITTEAASAGTDTVQSAITWTLATNLENLTLTGTSAINGTGNTVANTIIGNSAANVLDGGAGIDNMSGGLGDDIYLVDVTTDVTTEGASAGTDLVQSLVTWTLGTNFENLILIGSAVINGMGNTQDNILTGNSAANVLTGGTGNDTYIVGTGDTTIEAASAGTDLVQSSITWTLATNLENLTLTGGAVIDGTGNTVANIITGNSAANILDGGAGIDTLIGGLGNDTYVVDVAGDITTEALGEGTDLVKSSITWAGLAANIENLTLTGTTAINGTGNALDNVITGNTGINTLNGLDGNDTLIGGGGADLLVGGLGNDIYVIDIVGVTTTEAVSAGTDTVQSSVAWTLATNLENLTLTLSGAVSGTGNTADNILIGNTAVNTLNGLDGNDTLNGGGGLDTLIGGLGNDTYVVDLVGVVTTEAASAGTDLVQSSVNWTLATNLENLTLTGNAAITGTGNTQDNIILGNSAINTLNGGSGNDTLTGLGGNDTLTGGLNNDTFVFATGFGADIITDFTAGVGIADVMKLSLGTSFDTFAEVLAASTQVGANTLITFGAGDTVTLNGVLKTALVADDFLFV